MHLSFDRRLVEAKKSRKRCQFASGFLPSNAVYTSPAFRAASSALLNKSKAVVRSPASQAASALLRRLDIGSAMGWRVGFGSRSAQAAASDLLKSSWERATASKTQSANAWKTYAETFIKVA